MRETERRTKTPTAVEIETMKNRKKYGQAFQVTEIKKEIEIEIEAVLHYLQVADINRLASIKHTAAFTTTPHYTTLHHTT